VENPKVQSPPLAQKSTSFPFVIVGSDVAAGAAISGEIARWCSTDTDITLQLPLAIAYLHRY
jgi:hypothetical protein